MKTRRSSIAAEPRLRILFVTPFVPHVAVGHGTATVAAHTVAYFAERHDVTVVTYAFSEAERALAARLRHEGGLDIRAVPFPAGRWRQCRRRVSSLVRGVPYTIRMFDHAAMRTAIARAIQTGPFDVAQFDTTFMGQFVNLVGGHGVKTSLLEIDVTVTPLERRVALAKSAAQRAWFQREFDVMRRYEPSLCRQFDCVLAVSTADRAALRRLDDRLDPQLFQYGADPDLFDVPPKSTSDSRVLFVGAFLHAPNVDAARWLCGAILPALRRACPESSCTIVGGDPPPVVRQAAARVGATVTGRVAAVREFLAAADVGVVPLRSGGGVKLKTLEMMAAGRAIVTTPIGIEGVDARDGEHVLVASTATDFANAIVRLLRDDALRARLGRAARDLAARHHQWIDNLQNLERRYLALAGQSCVAVAG